MKLNLLINLKVARHKCVTSPHTRAPPIDKTVYCVSYFFDSVLHTLSCQKTLYCPFLNDYALRTWSCYKSVYNNSCMRKQTHTLTSHSIIFVLFLQQRLSIKQHQNLLKTTYVHINRTTVHYILKYFVYIIWYCRISKVHVCSHCVYYIPELFGFIRTFHVTKRFIVSLFSLTRCFAL